MSEPSNPASAASDAGIDNLDDTVIEYLNLLMNFVTIYEADKGSNTRFVEMVIETILRLRVVLQVGGLNAQRIETVLVALKQILGRVSVPAAYMPWLDALLKNSYSPDYDSILITELRRSLRQYTRLHPRKPNLQNGLTISLTDDVATTHALGAVLVTVTHLHTKLWLASAGRYEDVIAYSVTHDYRRDIEANLVIKQITMNSPVTVVLTLSQSLGQAIASIIDAVTQAPLRWQQRALETQMMQIRTQMLANEQAVQEQHASFGAEAKRLELEKERLNLLLQQTQTQEAILEAETRMATIATEILRRQIDRLYPDVDSKIRAMLVQSMLPDALHLGNYNLQLSSPDQSPDKP